MCIKYVKLIVYAIKNYGEIRKNVFFFFLLLCLKYTIIQVFIDIIVYPN